MRFSAIEKRNAPPAPPTANNKLAVVFGPILSSATPTGICIAANVKNQTPEAVANVSGVMPKSEYKSGAKTARKAR